MKQLLNVRIPSICICYTCITLANAVYNLLTGNLLNGFAAFMLQLFFWLLVCQAADRLMDFISFKSWGLYWLTETLVLYAGTLCFSMVCRWFEPTLSGFLYFTLIFLLADIAVFSYFRRRGQLAACEINELLGSRDMQ